MAGGNKVTKLELRLVDGLTGPAKAAVRSIGKLNKALASVKGGSVGGGRGARDSLGMATGGREATRKAAREGGFLAGTGRAARGTAGDTAALSGAAALGVTAAARQAYDMERQLNISQAAGNLDLAQRNQLMQKAVDLNAQYAATSSEIVGGVNELLKAGFSFDQAIGSINGVLDSAQAMELPISEASKAITDSMVSLDLPMRTMQESFASSLKMADLFARAVQATNASLEDFAVSSKYFNPVAKAFKMSAEEAMAWQMVLAKAGIRGSSAGTGLRAAPLSIVAPSKKGREAFGRLGLDPSQFAGNKRSSATGASVAGALDAAGFSAEGIEAGIDRLIADPRFKAAPAKLASAILDQFSDDLGVQTAEDRSMLSDTIQRALLAGVRDVDMYGFLKTLREKGASPADFKDIFGGNHASKMMAVNIDLFEEMLKLSNESAGTAKTMREAMMGGIVGDVAELTAAVEKMSIALGKSGLMAQAAKGIDALAAAISRLADSNPALLRLAGYATVAVAALAPLGFALSGVAAIAGLVASPLGLAAGAIGSLVALNLTPISNGLRTFSNALRRTIDPAIIGRMRDVRSSMLDFFSGLKIDNLGFNRAADEMGMAIGRLVNAAPNIGPTLTQWGASLKQFGADALAANLPSLTQGFDSLKQVVIGFVSTKVDAIMNLGTTFAGFFEKLGPMLQPSASSAITLVAESFRTLAGGFEAIGRVIGGATDGLVAFATSFLSNIDPQAMQSIANGLKAVLDAITVPVRALGDAFSWISKSVSGANGDITSFASSAGANVAAGLSAVVKAIASVGSYVPDFSSIVGAVSTFVNTITGLVERLAAAIQRMKDAVASMPSASSLAGAFGGVGLSTVPTAPKGGLIGSALAGTSLPRKAAGGLVRGGRSYLVGERGPEIATFGRTGSITPNHRLGGGDSLHIENMHIQSTDPQGVVREIERRWGNKIRRSNQIGIDGGRRG